MEGPAGRGAMGEVPAQRADSGTAAAARLRLNPLTRVDWDFFGQPLRDAAQVGAHVPV